MPEDPNHFLNELTIWKLKALAEEYGLDVSGCKYKRDYVQKLAGKKITEEQVRLALDKIKKGKDARAREGPEAEVKVLGTEIETIARAPTEPPELPKEDEASVERHLDEAIMLRPRLFEIDSRTEEAYGKMITGEFYEALRLNREARTKCLEGFSSYQVYSAAISIRAADELFSRLVSEKGELDPILRTALAEAKLAFIDGPPKRREDTLEGLEILALKAYDAFMANTEKEEAELKGLLADYESFGTRTDESRRYLEVAAQARQSMNVGEYSKLLKDARDRAETAKQVRTREIDNSFHIVRAATVEAREIGVDTSVAESSLDEARKAFDDGAFRRAVDMLASIEQQVDSAHLEQIKARRDLEAKQLESVQATIVTYEPILVEASTYGIDVQEGMLHIANAKTAVSRNDAVNGVKFTRRVKDIAASIEKALDSKRLERGVIKHIDGARCGDCGQESLYSYPDAKQKCMECGHTFSTVPEPAVTSGPTISQTPAAPPEVAGIPEQKSGAEPDAAKPGRRKLRLLRK